MKKGLKKAGRNILFKAVHKYTKFQTLQVVDFVENPIVLGKMWDVFVEKSMYELGTRDKNDLTLSTLIKQ